MALSSPAELPSTRPETWRLISAVVVLQAVAGICYPIAKYGLGIIEPFTFAFYRYLLSTVVLLALVRLRPGSAPVDRRDWWRIILLGILVIPLNQTLFLWGQSLTGAGHGAFLFSTTPVCVFLLAVVHLGEKATWRRALGILMAAVGVMTIMWSGLAKFGSEYLAGDLIIFISVIAWGYYTVLGKELVRKYGALRVTAYALASGSVVYFPFGLYFAFKYDYSQATPGAWGSVVYMALGLSVLVYVLWYWLIKHVEVSRIAVYHNTQPILASAAAYLFLGESLSAGFLIGGTIVLAGVLVTEL
ncbi:MAG: DMT family transporter [Candidatus Zixiibacteriota bacterium]